MGNILEFQITPGSGPDLKGTLLIREEPYWHGEHGQPFAWDWQNMLQFLSGNWSALMLEESLPLPLTTVVHPGDLWPEARRRWEDLPYSQVESEEKAVYAFWHRHNLALGLPGAGLPALIWLRCGHTVWLVDSENRPFRVDFHQVRRELEQMGDDLSFYYQNRMDASSQYLVQNWRNRNQQLHADYLHYRCPLPSEMMSQVYAKLPEIAVSADVYEDEPVFLAAARMARHHMEIERIGALWDRLRHAKKPVPNTELQAWSQKAADFIRSRQSMRTYEQGYELARWLRSELACGPDDRFDVESVLVRLDVMIDPFHFHAQTIDAIASWGGIHPLILLNADENSRALTLHGRRTTLAHELCHLLVDRNAAYPVAEVLGGEVDLTAERRANAFAAEMLLPQSYVKTVCARSSDILHNLQMLCQTHEVGKQLAAWQILNSDILLSGTEQIRIRQIAEGE